MVDVTCGVKRKGIELVLSTLAFSQSQASGGHSSELLSALDLVPAHEVHEAMSSPVIQKATGSMRHSQTKSQSARRRIDSFSPLELFLSTHDTLAEFSHMQRAREPLMRCPMPSPCTRFEVTVAYRGAAMAV